MYVYKAPPSQSMWNNFLTTFTGDTVVHWKWSLPWYKNGKEQGEQSPGKITFFWELPLTWEIITLAKECWTYLVAKFWPEWKKRGQRWRRETISRPSSPCRPQPSWVWTTTPPTKPSLLSKDRPPILVRWTILKMALPTSKLTKKKSLDNLASSQHSIVSNSVPIVGIVVWIVN